MKFTFSYQTPNDLWGTYESSKDVNGDDSARALALEVFREALESGLEMWAPELNNETAIQIYVASDSITDTKTGFEKTGFGIKYAIDNQGGLMVLDGLSPLHHDWKISEIQELVNEGYIPGDIDHLIIGLPEGLGADGMDGFEWAGFLSAVLQLGDYTLQGFQYIKGSATDKTVRSIARRWVTNGIRYPEQLREFIDTKGEWRTAEVCRRLKLDDEHAYKLLTSLGLELKENSWRLTHSEQSINNRRKWLQNERRYRKSDGQ